MMDNEARTESLWLGQGVTRRGHRGRPTGGTKSRGCDQTQALSGPERHHNWLLEMPARSQTQLLLGM